MQRFSLLEPIFSFHFSFFLMGFVSDVSRVFVVAVSHGLGPNLAAVRGFRRRYSKARFRDAFEASFVGDMSAPGSVRQGFPCWSQSFPFIFLSGPESCCCSRLSQAVLQGQISRRF